VETRVEDVERRVRDGRARIALGVGLPAGWIAHDLIVFAGAGRPELAFALLPFSAVLMILGGLLGRVAGARTLLVLALLAAAGFVLWPPAEGARPNQVEVWWPRAILLLGIAFTVVDLGRAQTPFLDRVGALRIGVFLGVAACMLVARRRGIRDELEWSVFLPALVALPIGLLPAAVPRRALTALLVLAPVVWQAWWFWPSLRPDRPDLAPPTARADAGAPDLLLIVLDTVRADHLGSYGYERDTTPELDAWTRRAFTRYTSARSTSSWTLPSHASLFTGLLPGEHGSVYALRRGKPLDPEVPTLAGILREHGYRTAAVMSNSGYLRSYTYGLERGYEHYDDRLAGMVGDYLALSQLAGASLRHGHLGYRDARVITDAALDWLDTDAAREGPWFLTLNYMDVHEPNLPVAPWDELFSEEKPLDPLHPERELQVLQYDRELAYLDRHVGRLLDALDADGRLDDTVVIVTSDHGEALGDRGFVWHGWVLYESLVRVPLLVKPVGGRDASVVDTDVTSADVFRMALELVGIEPPDPPGAELPVVAELHVHPAEKNVPRKKRLYPHIRSGTLLAWKEGTVKWIVSQEGEVEAYDLAVDPDERDPLALTPDEVESALTRARAWWNAHPVEDAGGPGGRIQVDADTLRRLDALGYGG
jgi:arylsulfatase A-like enzyme